MDIYLIYLHINLDKIAIIYLFFIYADTYIYMSCTKCLMLYTDGSIYYNDVWRSVDLGVTWVLSTFQASWAARERMSAVYIGGTIVLMGGYGVDI